MKKQTNIVTKSLRAAGFAALLPLIGSTQAATTLVSWDEWGGNAAATNADDVTTGFTGVWTSNTDRVTTHASLFSADGTFGNDIAGATTTDNTAWLTRADDGNLNPTISITNNTGGAYDIESLHFDLGFYSSGGSTGFTLTYTSGGLGAAATEIGSGANLWVDGTATDIDRYQYDYDLTGILSDITLDDGESALFSFAFTAGSNVNSGSMVDNVALVGTAVPEPSVALLGGLGLLGLLRRRRG